MQYFTQVHCSLLFHGYGLHYNTRSKGLTKKFYTVKRKIRNISLRFIILHGYGLNYNTRSKRVNENNYTLLCRRTTSFYANFRFIVHIVYLLHGCGLHYNVLSALSIKQEVKGLTKNYKTMHYPERKPVYLQIFELRLVSFASS